MSRVPLNWDKCQIFLDWEKNWKWNMPKTELSSQFGQVENVKTNNFPPSGKVTFLSCFAQLKNTLFGNYWIARCFQEGCVCGVGWAIEVVVNGQLERVMGGGGGELVVGGHQMGVSWLLLMPMLGLESAQICSDRAQEIQGWLFWDLVVVSYRPPDVSKLIIGCPNNPELCFSNQPRYDLLEMQLTNRKKYRGGYFERREF